MKKLARSFISVLLAVTLTVGLLPVSALADGLSFTTPAGETQELIPTDPEATPTDPEATPTDPAATPTDPAATPTDPEATPTDPAATPTDPAATPTDPAATPTDPAELPASDVVRLIFALEPADLLLTVYGGDGGPVAPQEDGSYLLTPGEYAYTAEKEGFAPFSGIVSVTGESESQHFDVALVSSEGAGAAQTNAAAIPGLPEGYTLSEKQQSYKSQAADFGEVDVLKKMQPGVDYVENEIIILAETEEEALIYAQAFGGILKEFSYGVATVTLSEGFSAMQAVEASTDPGTDLPVASANQRITIDPIEQVTRPVSSPEPDSLSAQSWQGARDSYRGEPFLADPDSSDYQWFHDTVETPAAHNTDLGDPDVVVAVLDSGIMADHEEFADVDNIFCYSVVDGCDGAEDVAGHGTHVSGIIKADNNNSKGGSGVAPNVTLISIRVADYRGALSRDNTTRGIRKAIEEGANVINMSFGGSYYNFSEYCVIQEAIHDHGITIVASAGNTGSNSMKYPAAYPDVIAVAATDRDGNRAHFSSYGPWVDIAAPGVDILSTTYDGEYGFKNGTSMAAPIVTGVVALLMSEYPELREDPEAVLKMLQRYSERSTSRNIGKGIVNAYNPFKANSMEPGFYMAYDITEDGWWYFEVEGSSFSFWLGEYKLDLFQGGYGRTVYYTLNGKNPSVGTAYTYEFTDFVDLNVKGKVTVKAMCIDNDGTKSAVVTKTFNIIVPADRVEITDKAGARLTSGALAPGKSVQLYAKLYSDNDMGFTPTLKKPDSWSITENSQWATVTSSGKVTLKPGAPVGAVIEVCASADEAQAYYHITVSTPISSLAFTKRSIELWGDGSGGGGKGGPGLSQYLLINGESSGEDYRAFLRNVSWTSSNPKILALDGSYPLVLGSGRATVTATAMDGSGKKATLSVTTKVYSSGVTVRGYSNGDNIEVVPGKSLTLSATVEPAGIVANKKVIWSGGSEVRGIMVSSTGRVSLTSGAWGRATVTAAPADGIGAPVELTINAAEGIVTSVSFAANEKKLTLYATQPEASATRPPVSHALTTEVRGMRYFSGKLVYTSSRPSVATVDNYGVITAVSKGTATITAAATDGSGKKATCSVTVIKPIEAIEITGAPDAFRENSLGAGKSLTLKAVVTADKDASNKRVLWEVSDPGCASVSNGRVTVSRYYAGWYRTVTVTAYAADGSGVLDSVEIPIIGGSISSMRFNNAASQQKLYCVDIPSTSKIENTLNISYHLDVTATGRYSNGAISWSSSNPSIVEVDGYGILTAGLYGGSATITAAATDGSGKKATVKITVLVPVSAVYVTSGADEIVNYPALAYGGNVQLKATYGNAYGTPSKTEQKVFWDWWFEYSPYEEDDWPSWYYSSYNSYLTAYDRYYYEMNSLLNTPGMVTLSSSGRLSVNKKIMQNSAYKNLLYRETLLEAMPNLKVRVETPGGMWNTLPVYLVEPTTYLYLRSPETGKKMTSYTYYGFTSPTYVDIPLDHNGTYNDFSVNSSNPAVAGAMLAYDNEYYEDYVIRVYIQKTGSARITVKALDGTNKSASVSLSIRA